LSIEPDLDQKYQELLELREKVGSLRKSASSSRQQLKRKNRD
jgi:hypothetical protein